MKHADRSGSSFRASPPRFRKTSAALSLALAIGLVGCGEQKSDSEYLDLAQQRLAQGDNQGYAIELKNALQQNPQNATARLMLGEYYLQQHDGLSAEKELNKALEYGAQPASVTLPHARSLHLQQRYQKLLDHTSDLDNLSVESRPELYYYRGSAQLALRAPTLARQEFAMAQSQASNSTYATLAKAYDALLNDEPEAALLLISPALEREPNNVASLRLLSRIHTAAKNFPAAVEAAQKARDLAPSRLPLQLDVAQLYLLAGDADEAEGQIDELLKRIPKHPAPNLFKAKIRFQQQDWEAAVRHAEQALVVQETLDEAKLVSGMANFHQQKWEQAYDHLAGLEKELASNHVAHKMLAFTRIKLGLKQTAAEVLSNLAQKGSTDVDILSGFGAEFVRQGRYREAIQLLKQQAQLDQQDDSALTKLGVLKLTKLNDASGVDDLNQALIRVPESRLARIALANHYLNTGDQQQAISTISKLQQLAPEQLDSYLLTADVLHRSNRLEAAEKTLNNAQQRFPTTVDIPLMRAVIALKQDQVGIAEQELKQALSVDPTHLKALLALYNLYQTNNQSNEALQLIDQAIAQAQQKAPLLYVRAVTEYQQRQFASALQTLQLITPDAKPYGLAQKMTGDIYLTHRDYPQALSHYQNWLRAIPDDFNPYLAVAKLQDTTGQSTQALDTIRGGIEHLPTNKALKLALIKLLFKNDQQQQALNSVENYKQFHGDDARLQTLLGSVFEAQGQPDKALLHHRNSFELAPSRSGMLRIVQFHTKQQQFSKAQNQLESWINAHPEDQIARLYQANPTAISARPSTK